MKKCLILLFLLLTFSFAALNVNAHEEPATNKDGSVVTGVLTASFDPQGLLIPVPSNLLFLGTTDLTVNYPGLDESDTGNPLVALNALDGFSTIEKWTTSFADNTESGRYDNAIPGSIDSASVVAGQSVRVFQVTTTGFVGVTGIVMELTPWVDYLATTITDSVLAIIPLKPLAEYSSYMAVLTNDIKDVDGNNATPDRTYYLTKSLTPWTDENGNSVNPILSDAQAQGIDQLRPITLSMEFAAASVGIDPHDIILSWTVQTQSVTRTLKTLRAYAQPAPTQIDPTGMNTSDVNPGWPGIADIHQGVITLPYYSDVPTDENPAAQLSTFWQAAPGAYVPPFDQFGLDPTSTHITVANPIPVKKNDQTVPIIVTVPNAASGRSKPANGWPVVIYGHGIGRNRIDALNVADTLASQGYATVAIDHPLHGVSPDVSPYQSPFYIESTRFAPIANERTFDGDFVNNETLAFGPDGLIDPTGIITIPSALGSLLTGRDGFRQGSIDLSIVAVSISSMDIDLDGQADLDASNMAYVGESWGSMYGMGFLAVEPLITRAALFWPGGGIPRFAVVSPRYGPQVNGILAQAGLEPGTADYELFLTLWQSALDAVDPDNWAAEAASKTPIMLHEVINDQYIPNYVLTAPLSGTEPLIKIMDLDSYSTSQASPDGLRSAGRFVPPAEHAQVLSPTFGSPAAYFEMQKQLASFIASHGGAIVVTDESTMVPVMQMQQSESVSDLTEKKSSSADRSKKRPGIINRKGKASRLELDKRYDPSARLK